MRDRLVNFVALKFVVDFCFDLLLSSFLCQCLFYGFSFTTEHAFQFPTRCKIRYSVCSKIFKIPLLH